MRLNSQPALEIYADDVKCTHGSTIGPVDENAVFYLISRGLSLAQARHLIYGMHYPEWKQRHQSVATKEQLARMEESAARNRP